MFWEFAFPVNWILLKQVPCHALTKPFDGAQRKSSRWVANKIKGFSEKEEHIYYSFCAKTPHPYLKIIPKITSAVSYYQLKRNTVLEGKKPINTLETT